MKALAQVNYGLKGSYQIDLKDKQGNIVESTEWFDNDITNVGLNYPYWYSFARCFMFLSLGATAFGSLRENFSGFSGPVNPITGYLVYDPTYTGVPPAGYTQTGLYFQNGQYIGWPGYELGSAKNSPNFNSTASTCGAKFTNQGVNLYRGWTIPTGVAENGAYLIGDGTNPYLNIGSLMLSPSSGSDPIGKYAFSLVDRPLTIPSGYSATITYQLALSLPTYSNPYNLFQSNPTGNVSGWFNTGSATTGTNGSENNLLSLWANLSGIYKQIYPGIELINALGACCIPSRGNQLEPYMTNCPNLNFYLSSDMTEFCVNQYMSPATGEFGAYNSNGLAANYIQYVTFTSGSPEFHTNDEGAFPSSPNDYYYSGITDNLSSVSIESTNDESPATISNIHLTNLTPISNYQLGPYNLPGLGYLTTQFVSNATSPIAYATAGSGLNPLFTNYGNKVVVSSSLRELPNSTVTNPLSNTGNGTASRTKLCNKQGFFPPILSMGTNSRYGSLTLGYNSSPQQISAAAFSPYLDFIFFDTSGRAANMPHYRLIPDIYLSNRGSGIAQVIFSITGSNGLQPTSINRFWQAYGFMGQGTNANVSGLDFGHTMFSTLVTDPTSSSFVPPGNAYAGYVFPGQNINLNVSGSDGNPGSIGNYVNNGTGWGAVYGVVASTGFYQSQIDCGLVDVPVWSGYTGTVSGIPDPTGTSLFWPTTGITLGLNISGIKYYLKGYTDLGYGAISDSSGFYSSGVYQMLGDINCSSIDLSPTGSFVDIINATQSELANNDYAPSSLNASYNGSFQAIYLTTGTQSGTNLRLINSSDSISINPLIFTGIHGNASQYFLTGLDNNNPQNIVITGFSFINPLVNTRGSGQSWTSQYISSLLLNTTPYVIGNSGATALYLTMYDNVNSAQTFYPLTGNANFNCVPTQFCAPVGYIQHFENISVSAQTVTTTPIITGYRLLPNYAYPNNNGVNTYSPVQGGQFPGLSTENGMQIFLTTTWNA